MPDDGAQQRSSGAGDRPAWLAGRQSHLAAATCQRHQSRYHSAVERPRRRRRLRVLQADSAATRWRLNGTADYVADADVADLIVVSAAAGEHTLVFVVDAHAAGLTMEPLDMAGGHRAFVVRFDDVTVGADALLGADEQTGVANDALRRIANTAVALHHSTW